MKLKEGVNLSSDEIEKDKSDLSSDRVKEKKKRE